MTMEVIEEGGGEEKRRGRRGRREREDDDRSSANVNEASRMKRRQRQGGRVVASQGGGSTSSHRKSHHIASREENRRNTTTKIRQHSQEEEKGRTQDTPSSPLADRFSIPFCVLTAGILLLLRLAYLVLSVGSLWVGRFEFDSEKEVGVVPRGFSRSGVEGDFASSSAGFVFRSQPRLG